MLYDLKDTVAEHHHKEDVTVIKVSLSHIVLEAK